MPSSTEPRSGLVFGWPYGEDGWNTGMDSNLLRIGRFGFHLSVKQRNLLNPPGSPAEGDSYIIPASATGAWAGQTNKVAVWVPGTPAGAWVFAAPRAGWQANIEAEAAASVYSGTAWVDSWNSLASRHFSVKDRNLTAPPGSPAAGHKYIPAATATGAWVGRENTIATYNGTAWFFTSARLGDTCFIEDENKLSAFYSSAWSAGIAI